MLALQCPAQNYAWGRPAEESTVAQLAKANGVEIDESKPFAELWMGTHPSGPAVISGSDGKTLKAWLGDHPEALGAATRQRFGATGGVDLPYLFKVLSVRTALSIQSHPDKALAERLHASNPKEYRDDNHKPEMALALESFEALCGFVAPEELKAALRDNGELRLAVGEAESDAFLAAEGEAALRGALKAAFASLMTADEGKVKGAISALVARLEAKRGGGGGGKGGDGSAAANGSSGKGGNGSGGAPLLSAKEALVLRLNEQYPGDVGVLSAFFLNLVSLDAGAAIYLAANEPHAYVSGEIVECMAASDNVIRAGLTPKFRDTVALCESLTYKTGKPEVLKGERVHDHVRVFRPPFDEFEIQLIEAPAGETVAPSANPGPMLLLVQRGGGTARASGGAADGAELLQRELDLHRGRVLFVPAGTALELTASGAGSEGGGLTIWAAAVNAKVFAPAAVPAGAAAAEEEDKAEEAEPALVAA